jgi:hypothetical protein
VLIYRNKHHFYVEEKTERAIWVHPYDDPDYIRSLPDSHPANPESQAARERREEIERAEERAKRIQARGGNASDTDTDTDGEGHGMSSRAAMMQKSEQEDKSWLQRQKDKLADHKEKRAKRKEEERRQRIEQEKQIRVSQSLTTGVRHNADRCRNKWRSTGRREKSYYEVNTLHKAHHDTQLPRWHTDRQWEWVSVV